MLPAGHAFVVEDRIDDLRLLVEEQGQVVLLTTDSLGWLPSHVAARRGSLNVLKFLAEEQGGLGLTTKSLQGITPAHCAARGGFIACLHFLVEREGSAVLKVEDNDGWSPAHSAVRGGHVAVLQFIVEQLGSWVIHPPTSQPQLDMLASKYGHREVLRYLKEQERRMVMDGTKHDCPPPSTYEEAQSSGWRSFVFGSWQRTFTANSPIPTATLRPHSSSGRWFPATSERVLPATAIVTVDQGVTKTMTEAAIATTPDSRAATPSAAPSATPSAAPATVPVAAPAAAPAAAPQAAPPSPVRVTEPGTKVIDGAEHGVETIDLAPEPTAEVRIAEPDTAPDTDVTVGTEHEVETFVTPIDLQPEPNTRQATNL